MALHGEKITYVEYFMLPNETDESCDWDDEFGVQNYFINGIGFTLYETDKGTILEIFDDTSKSHKIFVDNLPGFVDFISHQTNSNTLIPSDLRNPNFIFGLSETAASGDNDIESVYEHLGDIDIDFEYDTDNISESYANHFGCRIWELDVSFEIEADHGEVVLNNIDYNGESYDDIGDAFQDAESEGDVRKTMAIVSNEY